MNVIAPSIKGGSGEPIDGIGVLTYPQGITEFLGESGSTFKHNSDIAADLASRITRGVIVTIPVQPDGIRLWDFRIEGGPMDQVTVKKACPNCRGDNPTDTHGYRCVTCDGTGTL
jgi:hypothetical protein